MYVPPLPSMAAPEMPGEAGILAPMAMRPAGSEPLSSLRRESCGSVAALGLPCSPHFLTIGPGLASQFHAGPTSPTDKLYQEHKGPRKLPQRTGAQPSDRPAGRASQLRQSQYGPPGQGNKPRLQGRGAKEQPEHPQRAVARTGQSGFQRAEKTGRNQVMLH